MRFTLVRDRWYACEFIGDEFHEDKCSYSPIKVHDATPTLDGTRTLNVRFYHANYPEGVQNKSYRLQTLERGQTFLLARSHDHQPTRILLIYDIDGAWVARHFPGFVPPPDADIQAWLDRNA